MPSDKMCCVPGCKDSGDMHEVLHIFPNPQKDMERFMMWLSKIGGELLGLDKEFIHKYRRVCRRHFEHKYLCRYKRISKIAVPTLHTPALLLQKQFNRPRFNNNLVNRKPLPTIIDLPLTSTSSDQETKLKQVCLDPTLEIPPALLPTNTVTSPVIASVAATEVTTSDITYTSPDLLDNLEADEYGPVIASVAATEVTTSDITYTSHDLLDNLEADEYGPNINEDVANKFCHIATTGLNKDASKEFIEKYVVPENCKEIAPPLLNPEIKKILSEDLVEKDEIIEARQKRMACSITALGKIISTQIDRDKIDIDLIEDLMDVGRILCDIQYNESNARRNIVLNSVRSSLQDHLSNTKINKYLFGNNLPKRLNTAKVYKSRRNPIGIIQNP